LNFEMKRKMRQVAVQVQHVGTQLCWQLIVPEPGSDIGLAELVHVAKPDSFATTPPADVAPPSFETLSAEFQIGIPFQPIEYAIHDDEFIDGESQGTGQIEWRFKFSAPAPQPGYKLSSVIEVLGNRGAV
jgi:hypothetical protein